MSARHNAATQAVTGRTKRLISVGRSCPPWCPSQLSAFSSFAEQVFFREPGGTRQILGLGIAYLLESRSSARFADIEKGCLHLFADALIEGPGRGPQLVGGFAFTPQYLSDHIWQDFLPACFILPHFQLEKEGDACFLRINVWAESGEDAIPIQNACIQALDLFTASYSLEHGGGGESTETSVTMHRDIEISEPVTQADWVESVEKALALIQARKVHKVVLSRIREIRCLQGFSLTAALQTLLARYADCFTFLFRPGRETAFLGASPELLCKVEKGHLELAALAGTAPRLPEADQDQQAKQALWASAKNRREHQFVVRSIVDLAAQAEGLSIAVPAAPQILTLSNVHHLHTPLSCLERTAKSAMAWAAILHPTPALGGEPRHQALHWIDTLECQPRGWYGAPFGVVDSRSNGTFTVAIRSAAVSGPRAWLFAGAGIVEGSQPHAEWRETVWKFQPMQEALTSVHAG